MPDWISLLSECRPQCKIPAVTSRDRSPFQADFDKIVFSSHFRRLQDKTQVHPLPNSDYVRRRLTHSLEVSSVARSLGSSAGHLISQRYAKSFNDGEGEIASRVGEITAAGALAHDIGNPPFGHTGEKAIQIWAQCHKDDSYFCELTDRQKLDFQKFEGNAQGFRILSRLANNKNGLELTAATLGAFTKYPTASDKTSKSSTRGEKKHGFLDSESQRFENTAQALDLKKINDGAWHRHPLAYLVEAADDICYKVIDLEDGAKIGRIFPADAEALLVNLLPENLSYTSYGNSTGWEAKLSWLRATVINELIQSVNEVFAENEIDLREGRLGSSLLSLTSAKNTLDEIDALVREKVFEWDRTIKAEIGGTKMLRELLNVFLDAAKGPEEKCNKKFMKLIQSYDPAQSNYHNLLAITDYVSGMTDAHLQRTYKQLVGVEVL